MNQEQIHKQLHIFISHITEEEDLARKLKECLETDFSGLVYPFLSSKGLELGKEWFAGILDNLRKTDVLLLMCSPKSIEAPWLHFEAGAIFLQDKPVVPICYGGLMLKDLPHQFGRMQAINLDKPELIKDLYNEVAKKLPPFFKLPQSIDYQAISRELLALAPTQKILFIADPNLIDSYRPSLTGIIPHLKLEFTDYTAIDNKMADGAYKNKYVKIVYHHPHPDSSDPLFVQLIGRLKNDQASLPLITFTDGNNNCVDFATANSYTGKVLFANMITTLVKGIND